MKSSNVKIACFAVAENVFHTFFHFSGSLVGKSKSQYVKRINSLRHKMCDAGSENLGFSASCAGNNHQCTFSCEYGLPLSFIQSLQIILHSCEGSFLATFYILNKSKLAEGKSVFSVSVC